MAIIITRRKIAEIIGLSMVIALIAGTIIGVSTTMLAYSEADSLSDLRESVASGNVYVDSQSIIYKCEIK